MSAELKERVKTPDFLKRYKSVLDNATLLDKKNGQYVAEKVLEEHSMTIPVVGVVKDEKHRPRDIRGDRSLIQGRERDILLANAEAHRFAIGYHRKTSRTQFSKRSWTEPTIK